MAIGFDETGIAFDSPLYTFDGVLIAVVTDTTFKSANIGLISAANITSRSTAQVGSTSTATYHE